MNIKEKHKIRNIEPEFGKSLYSVQESYWIFYKGIRTMKYMFKAKRKKELSQKFIERIMLAVTEVNGCEICSYAHTKRALESGMSNEEIKKCFLELLMMYLLMKLQPSSLRNIMQTREETLLVNRGNA
ncbi:MAG: carboxymuconolactone decarboxylase family protein [Methanobacterium sp. ERen5]|nr:MAG: carboxymuconolactone decarboxylase family protein [Methanobacterium sp. ERen5]